MKQSTFDMFRSVVFPMDQPPHQAGSHSGWTGARQVVKCWKARQSVVLQCLNAGPMSRQELEAVTGLKINAVCSVVGALLDKDLIVKDQGNWDVQQWPDGGVTRRERFKLVKR